MKFTRLTPLFTAATLSAEISPPNRACESFRIPVTVSSEDLIYALPHFNSDFDVADFIDILSSRSSLPISSIFGGTHNVTAAYTIGATFCRPQHNYTNNTVLIATHGLNFDRSYWDPNLQNGNYSFVDFAVSQGYSVLFYDRLGVGESSRVSGYAAQLSNQVAILQRLVGTVRDTKYKDRFGRPKSVVLVGHSFGSGISLATVALDPTIADGLVLTGFSLNTSYSNPIGFAMAAQPRIAALQNPQKWSQLDTGYLTPADLYANVNTFFKKPEYDTSVAEYSDVTKEPFAITELLSAATLDSRPLAFTGPTMIIAGEYDFIFCTSDCNGALDYPASLVFPQAKAFKAVSYPNAGHGLNLHLNARGAFKEITMFLSSHGL
ncbi:hypothetical protein PV08_09826 [Exophiala spinifera]|uniref:AB hydrolase-1 domain-containing protein n=1 Tax=Exophiala spinifera TaxID=91928 RepID=A0A0D2BN59_9EURO|nr:uncharacterized protein PV08_09826 [Exophiala spinifera]KIW12549.1 hypothetical protein PV08_09826 [Exophiala spinifera]